MRWYLSDKVGDGWMILAMGSGDMRDDFIETVYKKEVGDQIVNDHNAVDQLEHANDEALRLVANAVSTGGGHHKQWYLLEIAKVLTGYDLGILESYLARINNQLEDVDPGVAP